LNFNAKERIKTIVSAPEKLTAVFLLAAFLLAGCVSSIDRSSYAAVSYSIELEGFRWTRFPLKVFVDMNQWAVPDYAVAVREALDGWVKGIWNYTHTFNDTSIAMINYVLYLSGANSTSDYDVLIAFAADNMPPGSNTVGLTSYSVLGHEPVSPVVMNITTFSATVGNLFVRNVVMHEFGHVLGVGHAVPSDTMNGPELMYYISSKDKVVYPSTLDVYALTELYAGHFVQSAQLPSDMPYVMLAEGVVPPPPATSLWEDYRQYFPIIAVLIFLIGVAIILGQITKEKKPEESVLQPPPAATSRHVCLLCALNCLF